MILYEEEISNGKQKVSDFLTGQQKEKDETEEQCQWLGKMKQKTIE